jgi:hypothetical protein
MIIFSLTLNLLAQSKGGHWQFENDNRDTAVWDQLADDGQLQGPAYFSFNEPVPEGTGYIGLDSLDAHDFFKIDDSDDLDFDNENIGISMWLYPVVLNNVHFILNKGIQDTDPKTTNYAVRISNGYLEFLIRDEANKAQVAISDIAIVTGEWMFIAIYYNYAEKKIYFWDQLTASPIDTVDFDQDYFSNDDPLCIGSWCRTDTLNPSIRDFEGYLDDVRISGRLEDILPGVASVQSDNIFSEFSNNESVDIFPNPVRISAGHNHIQFQIYSPNKNPVTYKIYNILGQMIFRGRSESLAGFKNIQWQINDNFGNQIRTGMYFVEFSGLQNKVVKKFLVVK